MPQPPEDEWRQSRVVGTGFCPESAGRAQHHILTGNEAEQKLKKMRRGGGEVADDYPVERLRHHSLASNDSGRRAEGGVLGSASESPRGVDAEFPP